ncbi:MAG TPA: hypothetical protein VD966_03040 [Pyrinomonadaceae bacterium]|nr:hypothetical protein [Pyrinomonadaceae bacterium]
MQERIAGVAFAKIRSRRYVAAADGLRKTPRGNEVSTDDIGFPTVGNVNG